MRRAWCCGAAPWRLSNSCGPGRRRRPAGRLAHRADATDVPAPRDWHGWYGWHRRHRGEHHAPSTDPDAAVAERWRAWRQQTAARHDGDQMATAARPTGLGRGGDGSRRPTRWEERRAARLRRRVRGQAGPAHIAAPPQHPATLSHPQAPSAAPSLARRGLTSLRPAPGAGVPGRGAVAATCRGRSSAVRRPRWQ